MLNNLFKKLSIQSQLMLILLVVCISSISAIAYIGYSNGQQALSNSIFNQLIGLREAKEYQIESYFKNLRSQVQAMSQMPGVIEAMRDLKGSFQEIEKKPVSPNWNRQLQNYYQQEFLPRLTKNVEGIPLLFAYLPRISAARYLQYNYIANNSNAVGKKSFLIDAKDGSNYSQLHSSIQSTYKDFIDKFGYYDMFLIDTDTGDIVYSVEKETDFATNLDKGPYARSGLAQVLEATRKGKDPGFVAISDFEPYRPSYATPAAFIASPIIDDSKLIGILAFQISLDQINKVMTGNESWEQSGLGKSGETYLVGEDQGMRSISRFLIEDPDTYFQQIKKNGLPDDEIEQIKKLNTSIFHQIVDTKAVKQALSGETGINISRDYRGIETLNAYSPIEISGLDWAVIAQIDREEAFAPIRDFQDRVLFSTSVIVLVVTGIAGLFSYYFVQPIRQLIEGFREVGTGKTDVKVRVQTKDEFRQMATSFNEMIDNLHSQKQLVRKREAENEQLLLSILPEPVANRLKSGEESIADSFSNVTVLFADLIGFTELSSELPANEVVSFLNDLVSSFDEAAELYGVEKVKTIGSGYMAVSGLSVPRIDHSKRVVDFSLEMIRVLQNFNRDRNTNLKIRIGINSGEVIAGIVGRSKFIYDLWGDTVNLAHRLQSFGQGNVVQVAENIYLSLKDIYDFESVSELEISGRGKIKTWLIHPH